MAMQVTDVQKALKGASYPASGEDLSALAKRNGADDELVDRLGAMGDDISGPDQVMHGLKGSLTGSDDG